MRWINTCFYDYENVNCDCNCVLNEAGVTFWYTNLDRMSRNDIHIGRGVTIWYTNLERISWSIALRVWVWVPWEDHCVVILNCYWECGLAHCSWKMIIVYISYACHGWFLFKSWWYCSWSWRRRRIYNYRSRGVYRILLRLQMKTCPRILKDDEEEEVVEDQFADDEEQEACAICLLERWIYNCQTSLWP